MKSISTEEALAYLNKLEQLCEYLETRPYKSDYAPERNTNIFAEGEWLNDKRYRDLRRGIIFWNTGHGWCRKKDWRTVLEQKRKEIGS